MKHLYLWCKWTFGLLLLELFVLKKVVNYRESGRLMRVDWWGQ